MKMRPLTASLLLPALLLPALLLAACASVPAGTGADPGSLFNDALFAPPGTDTGPSKVFAASPEMKRYLASAVPPGLHGGEKRRALADALSGKAGFKLEYDSTITRNAAEAFAARSGNCLSLVLLTASLAKALDIPVHYQNVYSEQSVSRSGGIIYLSTHVNLVLGGTDRSGSRIGARRAAPMTIDFLPPEDLGKQRIRVIREQTVVAMFLNNRAVESLAAGRLDDAYWFARHAIEHDPAQLFAYNTLGVVYRRHGNARAAERALTYVAVREPGNAAAISNLVAVLNDQGRSVEAAAWEEKLRRIDLYPPFHFFDLGVAAMAQKRYAQARDLFEREIARAAYYHEFHAWLASAHYALGDLDEARRHLEIALENSTTDTEREVYRDRLRQLAPSTRAGPGRNQAARPPP